MLLKDPSTPNVHITYLYKHTGVYTTFATIYLYYIYKKPVSAISAACPGGRKNEQGERVDSETLQGGKSRLGESPSLPVKKNKHGEYVGVRKLWGTRKKVSVEEVKECLGEKFDEAEKVEVVRVCKEDSGRTRWWFWLSGEEDVLERLDRVVINDVWKVEKKSPF